LNVKDAIAEIKICRITDPARAADLEAQMLGRRATSTDTGDTPEQKAARTLHR
jgi:hypothetical protein